MLHIKALLIGTGILAVAVAFILAFAFAAKTFGIIVLAIPLIIFFTYALGRMCLEMWGGQFR